TAGLAKDVVTETRVGSSFGDVHGVATQPELVEQRHVYRDPERETHLTTNIIANELHEVIGVRVQPKSNRPGRHRSVPIYVDIDTIDCSREAGNWEDLPNDSRGRNPLHRNKETKHKNDRNQCSCSSHCGHTTLLVFLSFQQTALSCRYHDCKTNQSGMKTKSPSSVGSKLRMDKSPQRFAASLCGNDERRTG